MFNSQVLKSIRGLIINPIVNTMLRVEYLNSMQLLTILRQNDKYKTPKHLIPYGEKAFSQGDEDGILNEIFNRIDVKYKKFVEVGIGDGLENNTVNLLFKSWSGLWIDGSKEQCEFIANKFKSILEPNSKQLKLVETFVFPKNINDILIKNNFNTEVDLFSLDIDGNDYHVMDAINFNTFSPRVIVVEYNAKFLSDTSWKMPYNENHMWDEKTDYFGCSLKAWTDLLNTKNYSLVGCNIFGTNAFFVRNDLLGDNFCEVNNIKFHYEPARYYLIGGYKSGHSCNKSFESDYFKK